MRIFKVLLLTAFVSLQSLTYMECADFVVFTFGSEHSDLTHRQAQMAQAKGITLRVIEQDGQSSASTLDAMRSSLESMKDQNETIVVLTERGSLFLNSSAQIRSVFESMETRLLISSTVLPSSNPSDSIASHFSQSSNVLGQSEDRHVYGTGVMGYADTLLAALNEESLTQETLDHPQTFFSELFSNQDLRTKYHVAVDEYSTIFQNLDGSEQLKLEFTPAGEGQLHNTATGSFPAIIQAVAGHEMSLISLNYLSNYLGKAWHPVLGCQQCPQTPRSTPYPGDASNDQPTVTLAIHIHHATPFLSEFLQHISRLSYNKSSMALLISNTIDKYESVVTSFVDESRPLYRSVHYINSSVAKDAHSRVLESIQLSESQGSQYLFHVDSVAHLTNENTIQLLMAYNRTLVAPLLSRRGRLWSNFWGAINAENGQYARSDDYLDIVEGNQRGLWNVPHISGAYLIKSEVFSAIRQVRESMEADEDDVVLSAKLRREGLFMFVVNEDSFGHLVNADQTTLNHLHNDLWEIFTNPLDWEEKYIHEQYKTVASKNVRLEDIKQPCPDVFWFPLVSETFAKHLVEEMEEFGQWSDGSNVDNRLEGGYESVPTRDIHMRQIEWEDHWLHLLKTYVYPMQLKLYQGYSEEPQARMNFVVRYKPTEQDRLRPHHDSSSYTLNIALNRPGVDYTGGGARFLRYDCAVTETRVGWTLMHPGRITHLHEGLPTTSGTRYIMVTFINP